MAAPQETTHLTSAPITIKQDQGRPVLVQGSTVVGQLTQSLNTRKAKEGDTVTVKVTQDVVSQGRILVRRDSRLIGRVMEVKAAAKEDPEARLGIVFDSVQLKGGGELGLAGVVKALAPALNTNESEMRPLASYDGGWPGAAQPQPAGGSPGNGSMGRSVDRPGNPPTGGSESAGTLGTPSGKAGHETALGAGNQGVLGMPGLSLIPSEGSHAAVIHSDKDIKLESGTQIVVEVR